MKNLFPIFLAILFILCLSTISRGQNYVHTRSLVIMGDSLKLERLDLRFRKVVVQNVEMGMKTVYIPETDVQEGNGTYQKSKVITYQIAMSDSVTVEMMDKIKQAIDLIMFNSPGTVVIIDTVDADAATFSEGWTKATSRTAYWYNETLSFSNVKDAQATYKDPSPFKRIEIWAERKSTHGVVALSINSGPEIMIDLYSPNYEIPNLVHAFDVPMGVHEIKYRITGDKNSASSNTYGLIDFFKIFR